MSASAIDRPAAFRSPAPVAIALGSNFGNRMLHLRRAIGELATLSRIIRMSGVYESEPVDSPAGAGRYLNMVVVGTTSESPRTLLEQLQAAEQRLGRKRSIRNAPRTIDLDLILYSGTAIRTADLVIPHPRYRERDFVTQPLAELDLAWRDPLSGDAIARLPSVAKSRRIGEIYRLPLWIGDDMSPPRFA